MTTVFPTLQSVFSTEKEGPQFILPAAAFHMSVSVQICPYIIWEWVLKKLVWQSLCTGTKAWTPLKTMCLQPGPLALLCRDVNLSLNNDMEPDEHMWEPLSRPASTHFHMKIISIPVWQQAKTCRLSNTNVHIHVHVKSSTFNMLSSFLAERAQTTNRAGPLFAVHVSIKGSVRLNAVWIGNRQ